MRRSERRQELPWCTTRPCPVLVLPSTLSPNKGHRLFMASSLTPLESPLRRKGQCRLAPLRLPLLPEWAGRRLLSNEG